MTEEESPEPTYHDYVKPNMAEHFKKKCHDNSEDFYSCGILLSAHLVLKNLMQHNFKGVWKGDKMSPKEAWEDGLKDVGHSGASASYVAIVVSHFSPRADEFVRWCMENAVVSVDWSKYKFADGTFGKAPYAK